MSVVAYTSSVAAPNAGNHVDKVIDLFATPLPIATIQLYGAGVDSLDGGATWTYLWKILDRPPGSTTVFVDSGTDTSTLQNPVLAPIDVWGNVRVLLIVTNTHPNPDRASNYEGNGDVTGALLTALQLPSVSFLQVRVQDQKYGLEKPAAGERNWMVLYRKLVATIVSSINTALAAKNQLGVIQTEDDPVDPAHPKAINQERIKYQGTADGTAVDSGNPQPDFSPGVLKPQFKAAFCMIWEVAEDVILEDFTVIMQNGGPVEAAGEDPYIWEVRYGTGANVKANTMAVLVNGLAVEARVQGKPLVDFSPLVLDSLSIVDAGWLLEARHYVALVCTQAPASAGRGVSAMLNCKRKV